MAHIHREDLQARKTARTSLINGQGEVYASASRKMKYDPDWYKASIS